MGSTVIMKSTASGVTSWLRSAGGALCSLARSRCLLCEVRSPAVTTAWPPDSLSGLVVGSPPPVRGQRSRRQSSAEFKHCE